MAEKTDLAQNVAAGTTDMCGLQAFGQFHTGYIETISSWNIAKQQEPKDRKQMDDKTRGQDMVSQRKSESREEYLERSRRHYQEHKDEMSAYRHKYRQEHKEEIKAYQRKYCQEHKEEIKAYQRKYRQEYEDKKNARRSLQEQHADKAIEHYKAHEKCYLRQARKMLEGTWEYTECEKDEHD